MSSFTTNLISAFLLPPLNLIVLGLIGVALLKRWPRFGKTLIIITLMLLYGLSTPYFGQSALQTLAPSTRSTAIDPKAGAIVVLGAGTYFSAPEFGRDTANRFGLERLRFAAHLHKKTDKPILVSGGKPLGNDISEASLMKATLVEDFQVPVTWTEEQSNSTYENAFYSHDVLNKAGINTIYLVTHAWHMPRASLVFKKAGFIVVPAAVGFTTRYGQDPLEFIPSADALFGSKIFLRESIGLLWYQFRFWFD